MRSLIFGFVFLSSSYAFSQTCFETLKTIDFSQNPLVQQLNSRLTDPDFKIIILGRHGKASQKNKFTAEERKSDPKKIKLDIKRPLAKKGKKAARRLADLMSQLMFKDVGMWGSHAKRVKDTAKPTIQALGKRVRIQNFTDQLYYADVPYEMNNRLTSEPASLLPHTFFWGHGKTTLALFKDLTGAEEGFLPTAAVMIVAVKAQQWEDVFAGKSKYIEAYAWSPNNSHYANGGHTDLADIEEESMLESTFESSLESSPESVARPDNQGFEFFVLKKD